jgi:ABC-type uncharacterized transport system permease subunit
MKQLLALTTLALVILIAEEKGRQVAGDARDAAGEAVKQASDATQSLVGSIKAQPLVALLVAGAVGYVATWFTPRRGNTRRRSDRG